jgi:hypothetical protein
MRCTERRLQQCGEERVGPIRRVYPLPCSILFGRMVGNNFDMRLLVR